MEPTASSPLSSTAGKARVKAPLKRRYSASDDRHDKLDRKGQMRRKLLIAVAVLALMLTATATAEPTGKPVHDVWSDGFVDTDFCGTGADVSIGVQANEKLWFGETGGDEQVLKAVFNVETTFTYGSTTLVERSSGQSLNTVVVGLEAGAHTHEFVERGLRARLKLENGRVLIRDAGVIIYRVSFDAEGEFIGIEILDVRGPHPAFDSDEWCDAATAALSITV